jgi:hypothetical protein
MFLAVPVMVRAQFAFTTNNGTLTITHYVGNGPNAAFVNIPAMTNGMYITGIGDNAFKNGPIISVVIPSSITNIGNGVFSFCSSLTNISIPDSVVTLGNQVCQNDMQLKNAQIGNGVTSIGVQAFLSCTVLSNVSIGQNVVNIGDQDFGASSLTNILIPDNVVNIGTNAFNGIFPQWRCI